MASKKAKSSPKSGGKSSHGRAAGNTLSFPSVATHAPKQHVSHSYDSLGIPFKAPAGDCVMDLVNFFGAGPISKITSSGQIQFHLMGDSGVGTVEQENVAEAMSRDIDDANHELGPSFMVHVGDVIYGPNKAATYSDRFYRMYDHYNRLIFAVPGNHDGEVFPSTDPDTLAAFKTNFCSPVGAQPPLGKQFGMLMPTQPGPYWHLRAPFVDVVGLYSNADENSGIISNAKVGDAQKKWLQARLKDIVSKRTGTKRNALVIAVHHPPYARGFQSSGYGHPGNPEMLSDIDACCSAAGLLPDAVLAGHTHSYQHYERTQSIGGKSQKIPYLIVGTGGIGLQRIPAPTGVKDSAGDVLYFSAFKDYGYLTVTVSAKELKMEFIAVVATHREVREQVTVPLN